MWSIRTACCARRVCSKVRDEADGEHLDFVASCAWAMVDHQLSHIFTQPGDTEAIVKVRELFEHHAGIAEVLTGVERADIIWITNAPAM